MRKANNKKRTEDILGNLKNKKLKNDNHSEIQCSTILAIRYRDILEAYLSMTGASDYFWSDSQSRILERQAFLKSFLRIIVDLVCWLPLYFISSRRVSKAKKQIKPPVPTVAKNSVLFLRTDHWFNIISGGSVGHLSGVINGFRSLGYSTHVVSTDYLAGVEQDSYFHLCEPLYGLGRNIPEIPEIIFNSQLINFIEKQWTSWAPSFIYQRYSLGNYTGVEIRQEYGIPFVCEYNGSFVWMARQWGRKRLLHEQLLERIELLNLQAADLVVVVSQPMEDELIARGIQKDKILVNPNGVDPDRYSPDIDGSIIKGKYDLEGRAVIGFIGTFGMWHGAEVLMDAFGLLLKRFKHYHQTVRLLMIGEGPTMPLVKAKMTSAGIEDACIITGLVPQEKGPLYLAACDILVSPQIPNPDGTPFFGSPTKLFEYMAMGKGIIASNLDQIGEILEHGKTGWLIKPGDVESLAAGLEILIKDEQLRSRLGREARNKVLTEHTWNQHTARIIEKLKQNEANNVQI